MAEGIDFFQIYYQTDQIKEIYPFSIPHFNQKLDLFFENTPIVELVSLSKSEKVGVVSWKLRQKFKFYSFRHQDFTEDRIKGDYDVLSLTKNTSDHRMLRAAESWHPGFINTMTILWGKLGLRMPTEVRYPINHNYFIAKTEIYKEYIDTLLKPAMDLFINDPELNRLGMQDSKYTSLEKKASMVNIKRDLNLDYYPMFPFLCERLFPMWCEMKKIKVNYL